MKISISEEKVIQGAKKILQNQSFYQGKLIFKRDLPTRVKKVKLQEKVFWNDGEKEIFVSLSPGIEGTAVDCLIPLNKKKINLYKFIE